jgi:hypothetical protein
MMKIKPGNKEKTIRAFVAIVKTDCHAISEIKQMKKPHSYGTTKKPGNK